MVPTHLAQCWLFPLCSLDSRQAQGFRLPGGFDQVDSFVVVIPQVQFLDKFVAPVVAIPQEQFLDKVVVILPGAVGQTVHTVWRRRSCSSSSRTLTSP